MAETRRRRGRPPKTETPHAAESEILKDRRPALKPDDLKGKFEIKIPESLKPKGVQDGDIYKHYAERDMFCILVTDDKNIKYMELVDTVSPAKFKELNHEAMLRDAKVMSKSNADAISADGTWIFVENIVKSWGG